MAPFAVLGKQRLLLPNSWLPNMSTSSTHSVVIRCYKARIPSIPGVRLFKPSNSGTSQACHVEIRRILTFILHQCRLHLYKDMLNAISLGLPLHLRFTDAYRCQDLSSYSDNCGGPALIRGFNSNNRLPFIPWLSGRLGQLRASPKTAS